MWDDAAQGFVDVNPDAPARDELEVMLALYRALPPPQRAEMRAFAEVLLEAECHQSNVESALDAKSAVLRRGLVGLGGDRIETTRLALTIQRRIALAADDYRSISEPHPTGGEVARTVRLDRGGAARLQQIDAALHELDDMATNARLSPATVESRCAELIAEVEAGPVRPPNGDYSFQGNSGRVPWAAAIRKTIEKYRPHRRR